MIRPSPRPGPLAGRRWRQLPLRHRL